MIELVVFIVAGSVSLGGGLGLVLAKNPVHGALMLVMSLFGIAVLFLNQDAQFLAAVQVIVYAGAIVVMFLFVIMLLGVDQAEDLSIEPVSGQRGAAVLIGAAILVLTVAFVAVGADAAPTKASGAVAPKVDSITASERSAVASLPDGQRSGIEADPNIEQLGRVLFTDYVFAFEITALLLTIAVVGAVMLTRRPSGELSPIPVQDAARALEQAAGEADSSHQGV